MTRLINHIWLDLNNVAEDYESYEPSMPEILDCVCDKLEGLFGIKEHEGQLRAFADHYGHIDRRHPLHHYPSFWQHTVERVIHRTLTYDEIERAYDCYLDSYAEYMKIYADFLPLLTECRKRGLSTGIIANGNSKRIYRFLAKYGIDRTVSTIVTSGANPFSKPAREIFALSLTNIGLPAHNTVFIGDRIDTDVAGSNNAGMWSIHLRRGNEFRRTAACSEFEFPDFSIDSLDEVFNLPIFQFSNEVTSVVIPCGGRGSRMGALTQGTQKCMLGPDGSPVLYQLVRTLGDCGIRDFHLLLGYRSNDVINFFERMEHPDITVHFHDVGAVSTGEALSKVLGEQSERFLYCHGNILFDRSLLSRLIKLSCRRPETSCFVVTSEKEAPSHPVFIIENNRVINVLRHPEKKHDPEAHFSLGLGVINKRHIVSNFTAETYKDVTVEQLLSGSLGELQVLEFLGSWLHLEKASDIDRLHDHINGASYG